MGRAGTGGRSSGGRSSSGSSKSSRSSGTRSSTGSRSSRPRSSSGSERSSGSRDRSGRDSSRDSRGGRLNETGNRNTAGRSHAPGGPQNGMPPRGGMGGPPPEGGYGRRGRGCGCSGPFTWIVLLIVFLLCAFTIVDLSLDSPSLSVNSGGRQKLDPDNAYNADCIIDELGWIGDAEDVGGDLEYFYEQTGIQPYIYLKDHDADLETDDEKLAYAGDWYEENIDDEGTFLFIYFAEEDTDSDVGYMCYVCGREITSVMDDEAIDIFWEYVDEYWYSDLNTDEMFIAVFADTADAIMAQSADAGSPEDILKTFIIGIAGIIVIAIVLYLFVRIRKRNQGESLND